MPPTKEEYMALVHPEDRAFVVHRFEEMLATRRSIRLHEANRCGLTDRFDHVRCVGVLAAHGRDFSEIRRHGNGCH